MTLVEKNEDYDTQFDPEIAELRNMVSKDPSIKTKMGDIVKSDSGFSLVIEGIESARLCNNGEKSDGFIEGIYNVEELEYLIGQTLFDLCNENNQLSEKGISKDEFYARFYEKVCMVRLGIDIEDFLLYLMYSELIRINNDFESILAGNQSLVVSNAEVYKLLSELTKGIKTDNKGNIIGESIIKIPFGKGGEMVELGVNFDEGVVAVNSTNSLSSGNIFDKIDIGNIKLFIEYFLSSQGDNKPIMVLKGKTLKFNEGDSSKKFSIFDVGFDIDRIKESILTAMEI